MIKILLLLSFIVFAVVTGGSLFIMKVSENYNKKIISVAIVDGEVLHRYKYACDFGVLYRTGSPRVLLRTVKDKLILCDKVDITVSEYSKQKE